MLIAVKVSYEYDLTLWGQYFAGQGRYFAQYFAQYFADICEILQGLQKPKVE